MPESVSASQVTRRRLLSLFGRADGCSCPGCLPITPNAGRGTDGGEPANQAQSHQWR